MRNVLKAFLLSSAIAALCAPAFADTPGDPADPEQTPPPAPATPAPKPAPAGPIQIKVNDNVNFRFGVLLQPQLDFQENATEQTSENLMLRRVRFIASGQVAKNAYFFFQTENSRLGGAIGTGSKVISTGFQTIDAVAEYRFSKPFNIWAGLIYVPTSREALKGSASEYMIDVNTYAFTATTALAGTGGRDTGFMARGYFLGDKLEYRAGLFQGLRQTGSRNAFRQVARLQYNFFDTEVYNLPSYSGGNFGAKKIVAIGGAWDKQNDFKGPTADVYVDWPTAFGAALGTATVMRLDGGAFIPTLGKSNTFVVDGGLFFKGNKLGPWARYEQRNFASPNASKDEKRYLVGLNWYPYLNNFNIKGAVGQLKPAVGNKQKQATLQMQFSYY
jgi:phosphate-selective porin O/P